MQVIIKRPHTVFPLAKAEELVETLNNDPEDDWTYEVVPNPDKTKATAIVSCTDEDGEFVSYL